MLLDLKYNLNKRGIVLLERLYPHIMNEGSINNDKWKTNTKLICESCYLLVVAEQELQKIER